jgi:DNA-binding FrmR family transcriptional regulator
MSHTIHHKKKLKARVRRTRGQVEAIERALDKEAAGQLLDVIPSYLK